MRIGVQGLYWGADPSKEWGRETKKGEKPIKHVLIERLPL